MRIYNTLTRSVEEFEPLNPLLVGVYSCGPTVYDYQHIGHMRRYVGDDILVRVLKLNGYEVKHVMNITDVGHLTSDSDTGEDKMEEGAKKYKESVWDIAKKFQRQFFDSCKKLNIEKPDEIMRATDYIDDQIALVEVLEKKGFTYKTSDGIYFDTSKFKNYGELSTLDSIKEGARVEVNPEKRNPRDFAVWKFSPKDEKRQMEWKSPWGVGFPGWHLECSAMSMRALGMTLDIHTGGIDHISIHHQNEIAQSEAATGEQFVRYWVHHNFLQVEGKKMSKSLGNFITVQDVIEKGFEPLALRYLYLQTHYRQEMNFTWESLTAAQNGLHRLKEEVLKLGDNFVEDISLEEMDFLKAVNDDLNMPKALGSVWELLKSDEAPRTKVAKLKKIDEVLGLKLFIKEKIIEQKIPQEVLDLVGEREKLRKERRYPLADQWRNKIRKLGFDIEDQEEGWPVIVQISGVDRK